MRRRAGPVTEISDFCDQDLSNQAGNFFPYKHSSLDTVTKHFQLRMACKVADKLERGSTGILGAFWTFFISVPGLNFPYEHKTKFVPPTGP